MPHRLVSFAILLFWLVAAVALFQRDILPDLVLGPPPDLRTVTQAREPDKITRWSILIADPAGRQPYRPIGQVQSKSMKRVDGSAQWRSDAWFDGLELLGRNRPAGTDLTEGTGTVPEAEMVLVQSVVDVDAGGNLFHMRTSMRGLGETEEVLSIEGHLEGNEIEFQVNSPLPMLRGTRRVPYTARGIVEDPLSPLDRIPNLRLGQRWESRMASPLTGAVNEVKSEVTGHEVISWNNDVVKTLVVVNRVPPISYKTWVRPDDGLVLRQEVPYPLARLMLERTPQTTPVVLPQERPR